MNTIREKLHKIQANTISQEQINSASGPVFLSDNVNLREAEKISQYAHSTRTFGAFPDPGGGSVAASGSATSLTVQPTAGNQYLIQSISIINDSGGDVPVFVDLTDGSNAARIITQSATNGATTAISLPYPIYLTNGAYLVVSAGGTMTNITAAYMNTVRGS